MYKKAIIILTIIFINQISFAYAQKGVTTITGTISDISPVYQFFGDLNTPEKVHISLKEYPDIIFEINRELAVQNSLAYPSGKNATEKYRIIGWKVKLSYDEKQKSTLTSSKVGEKTKKTYTVYDVISFKKLK